MENTCLFYQLINIMYLVEGRITSNEYSESSVAGLGEISLKNNFSLHVFEIEFFDEECVNI